MSDPVFELAIATVGAVAGAILFAGGTWLVDRRRSTRTVRRIADEPLTGVWTESIDATTSRDARKDVVICVQNGSFVSGSISRFEPTSQSHREYDFFGTVEGPAIYCAFWPTNSTGDRGSYGSFYLRQKGPNDWDGFYVSLLEEMSGVGGGLSPLRQFVATHMRWALAHKAVSASDIRRAQVFGHDSGAIQRD